MIRLVNSGRMIISTHSDSMAINMNNLLTFTLGSLSEEAKLKKMKELGLEEADLLKTEDIYVYQFTNSDHGTSKVSEIEYREINNLGYDFELFNKNIQKLSDDTIKHYYKEAHLPSLFMAWRHLFRAYNQRGIRSVRATRRKNLQI